MAEHGLRNIKTAFLCDCLGPYHYARASAANRILVLTAIEFSSLDQTNIWDPFDDDGRCPKVTLFNDKPMNLQPGRLVMKRMQSVLNDLRPQVVVVSGWDSPASLTALWWCLCTKTPAVLMSESQEKDERRVWGKEMIKGRIVRLNSSGFVGGTPHVAYLKSLGMPEDRIFSGCDVVDNDYFFGGSEAARKDAPALRKKFFLPDSYFLASSRFVQKKNIFSILYAYADYLRCSGENPWKLVLLGDGPLRSAIAGLREDLGLTDMVLMPGFKQYPELPIYYGLAGAFVHASNSEPWGLVVNEAMACGLPVVVSSRCGCAPDLVKDGRNGFTFDPYDIDALSRHLGYIASAECPRDSMGEHSRMIISDWSPDVFAANLYEAVKAALKVSVPSPTAVDQGLLWWLIVRNNLHWKQMRLAMKKFLHLPLKERSEK